MIAVLVVLYNKDLQKSETLNTLLNCHGKEGIKLQIVNNGPDSMGSHPWLEKIKKEFHSFSFVEFLNNKPLSVIYNDFIRSYVKIKYYVVFDDDSVIHEDFFLKISKSEYDLILPIIQSRESGDVYYPKLNEVIICNEGQLKFTGLMSISSGLAISEKLVSFIKYEYCEVFDESFALYGIDTSLFYRLQVIACKIPLSVVCMSVIEHSLSRVDATVSPFRKKERLYDAAVTARRYPSFNIYYHFSKQIIKLFFSFKIKTLLGVLKCYAVGKHPRC